MLPLYRGGTAMSIQQQATWLEAPSFGKSIFQYAADSHGAEDYRRLAEEIVGSGLPGVSV
jgi:hypothetical protein